MSKVCKSKSLFTHSIQTNNPKHATPVLMYLRAVGRSENPGGE